MGTRKQPLDISAKVFTGAVPLSTRPSIAATLAIIRGEHPPRPNHPDLTDALWRLMQRCWAQEPHLRPEMAQVLQVFNNPQLRQLPSHACNI